MAASISKDQIIEFISRRRDALVLVGVVLLGAWGYLELRAPLSLTVSQIIDGHITRGSGGQGGQGTDALNSTDLVDTLASEPSVAAYRVNRSPFGTPAEQLKLRQEVQQLYQRGVDLYKTGKYELAMQHFNRVKRLDVTETRIAYAIAPSEYIRLADRQVKLRNLDSILVKAQDDIQRAAGLASSSPPEAVNIYESVLLNLRNLLSVDPQGEAMGQEKFDQVSAQVTQLDQTVMNLKRQTLGANVDAAISGLSGAGQQAASDAYGLLLAVARGREVQQELQTVDADGSVVPAAKRTQLNSLVASGEKTLAGALDSVAQQVQDRMKILVQQGDFPAASECVKAVGNLGSRYSDNRALAAAQIDVMATYLGGLVKAVQTEVSGIKAAFQKGDYTSYDPQAKEVLLGHLSAALSLDTLLSETDRAQLAKFEDALRRIKPPPPLDTAYDLVYFRRSASQYRARVQEKSSGKEISLSLRLNRQDKSGYLLKQVDIENRVVILSKPPDYAPSQFKWP